MISKTISGQGKTTLALLDALYWARTDEGRRTFFYVKDDDTRREAFAKMISIAKETEPNNRSVKNLDPSDTSIYFKNGSNIRFRTPIDVAFLPAVPKISIYLDGVDVTDVEKMLSRHDQAVLVVTGGSND